MTWAVFQYAMVWLHPWLFLLEAIFAGLITIWDLVVRQRRLAGVFRYSRWRDDMFATFMARVGPGVAQSMDNSPLPLLVRHAQGVVVDIGPGSGEQLHRYDVSKITRIYGIEPNTRLFPALRENIKKAGLEEIYTIVPCGVEHKETLKEHGIEENSIDSVLTIHVLCSVPNPKETVAALYEYLKPGGQFIYFEHVKSTRFLARLTQDFLMIIWPTLIGNCHLNRSTSKLLAEVGTWRKMEVGNDGLDSVINAIPHIFGRLIK